MNKTIITLSVVACIAIFSTSIFLKRNDENHTIIKNNKKEIKKEEKAIRVTKLKRRAMDKFYNNNKYDKYFKFWYNFYFPEFNNFYNYKIIKAQAIQESLLNNKAISYVGARGLMQFMPNTAKEVKVQLKIKQKNPELIPEYAIKMGCYYDRKLFNTWKSKRKLEDRYKLMFASYNAGLGNILKAQKECGGCLDYNGIIKHLHKITGKKNSKETINYVDKIFKYYKEMEE